MLDSKTMAATLAVAIALCVAWFGLGLMDPVPDRGGDGSTPAAAPTATPVPGPGLRGVGPRQDESER